jgi:hypothetical protein
MNHIPLASRKTVLEHPKIGCLFLRKIDERVDRIMDFVAARGLHQTLTMTVKDNN